MAGVLWPMPSLAQAWGEAKDKLVALGVTPAVTYDGDVASNLSGGDSNCA